MTPVEFIGTLRFPAQDSMAVTKIPASFVIADAALESGWGTSSLTVLAMNLFGVKADASWTGDTYSIKTREYVDGKWVMELAPFRKYESWLDSLNDHAKFLMENPRYVDCFKCTDGISFAEAVAAAGYATDPNYASKIVSIINGNHLLQFDGAVTATEPTPPDQVPFTPPPPQMGTANIFPVSNTIQPPVAKNMAEQFALTPEQKALFKNP